jgi:hypothetical protein
MLFPYLMMAALSTVLLALLTKQRAKNRNQVEQMARDLRVAESKLGWLTRDIQAKVNENKEIVSRNIHLKDSLSTERDIIDILTKRINNLENGRCELNLRLSNAKHCIDRMTVILGEYEDFPEGTTCNTAPDPGPPQVNTTCDHTTCDPTILPVPSPVDNGTPLGQWSAFKKITMKQNSHDDIDNHIPNGCGVGHVLPPAEYF